MLERPIVQRLTCSVIYKRRWKETIDLYRKHPTNIRPLYEPTISVSCFPSRHVFSIFMLMSQYMQAKAGRRHSIPASEVQRERVLQENYSFLPVTWANLFKSETLVKPSVCGQTFIRCHGGWVGIWEDLVNGRTGSDPLMHRERNYDDAFQQ